MPLSSSFTWRLCCGHCFNHQIVCINHAPFDTGRGPAPESWEKERGEGGQEHTGKGGSEKTHCLSHAWSSTQAQFQMRNWEPEEVPRETLPLSASPAPAADLASFLSAPLFDDSLPHKDSSSPPAMSCLSGSGLQLSPGPRDHCISLRGTAAVLPAARKQRRKRGAQDKNTSFQVTPETHLQSPTGT